MTRPIPIDAARIGDDPQTRAQEIAEDAGYTLVMREALRVAPDTVKAFRWLAMAYCVLSEDTGNPTAVIDAGVALLASWRDNPSELRRIFDAARSKLDDHLDAIEDFDAGPTRDMSTMAPLPKPPRKS